MIYPATHHVVHLHLLTFGTFHHDMAIARVDLDIPLYDIINAPCATTLTNKIGHKSGIAGEGESVGVAGDAVASGVEAVAAIRHGIEHCVGIRASRPGDNLYRAHRVVGAFGTKRESPLFNKIGKIAPTR